MLGELHTASGLLRTALERYINACSALHNGSSLKNNINNATEISNFVHNELKFVEAYKYKLMQAEIEVKKARNNLTSVPGNRLPPEVLAHIFHLASAQLSCPVRSLYHSDSVIPVEFPRCPDIFTHVCLRWRQIALTCRGLWSHIDIRLSYYLSKGFFARAKTFVARTQSAPLDIHFIDSSSIQEFQWPEEYDDDSERSSDGGVISDRKEWDHEVRVCNPEEFTFLSGSPRPRISSLGLVVNEEYHPVHSKALEYCLSNCLPGDLSGLFIDVTSEPRHRPLFLQTLDPHRPNPSPTTDFSHFLSGEQLENTWRSTTTLYLKGIYPRWSSSAYCGLTDFRLFGRETISESELAGILTSSPGLRVLHCNFKIHGPAPSNTPVSQVVLQELEVLNLEGMDESNTKCILGWLKPGLKSPRLSISGSPTSTMLKDFFARSNVQEMRVAGGLSSIEGGEPISPSSFFLPPQLRTLVIAG